MLVGKPSKTQFWKLDAKKKKHGLTDNTYLPES